MKRKENILLQRREESFTGVRLKSTEALPGLETVGAAWYDKKVSLYRSGVRLIYGHGYLVDSSTSEFIFIKLKGTETVEFPCEGVPILYTLLK